MGDYPRVCFQNIIKQNQKKDFGKVYPHFEAKPEKIEDPIKHRFNSYYNSLSLPTKLFEKMRAKDKVDVHVKEDYWGHKVTDKEYL